MKKNVESDENIVRFMILCLKIAFLVLKLSEITFSSFGSVGFFNRVILTSLEFEKKKSKKKKKRKNAKLEREGVEPVTIVQQE
jgi:hypothetical protein